MAKGLESALVPLEEIKRLPKNAKSHDIGAISVSLDRWGFLERLIVNRRTGHLISGHGRLDTLTQARASGAKMPAGLETRDGRWLVPVDYVDLPEDQEMPAAIALNRTVELGGWDEALLAPILAEIATTPEGLSGTGFDGDDVDRMMRELNSSNAAAAAAPEPQFDEAAELQKKWRTEIGQIWRAGPHRIICGDSRMYAVDMKATVVLTDPPYNVGKDYGSGTDDEKSAAEYLRWTREWFAVAKAVTETSVVLTIGITNLPMWLADIERTHAIVAWIKTNQLSPQYIGPGGGFNCWEPVLVYGRAKKCIPQDIFDIPIGTQADTGGHPCPKSLKAWTWLLEHFTDRGDSVADFFLGSGTTLVAAQQSGRVGYGIEIDPRYVAVTLERLAAMDLKPELLMEGPGNER